MVKYTVKRLLQSLITVFVVATIVFLLMRMLPTDYYFAEDQVMKLTEEQKKAILDAYNESLRDNGVDAIAALEEIRAAHGF